MSNHPPQRPKSQNKILFFILRFCWQLVKKVRTDFFDKLSPPADAGGLYCYTVPVTVSTAVPGVTLYAPVAASWVKVAAGTVMTPGTVANTPVAAS